MAKFIKSLFNPTDKKTKSHDGLDENRDDFTPPLDSRRKLSISRSGRMKQYNKKRRSLTLDVYGENLHLPEKQTTKEYHVHGISFTQQNIPKTSSTKTKAISNSERPEKTSSGVKSSVTPEDEIDQAFDVIEKT